MENLKNHYVIIAVLLLLHHWYAFTVCLWSSPWTRIQCQHSMSKVMMAFRHIFWKILQNIANMHWNHKQKRSRNKQNKRRQTEWERQNHDAIVVKTTVNETWDSNRWMHVTWHQPVNGNQNIQNYNDKSKHNLLLNGKMVAHTRNSRLNGTSNTHIQLYSLHLNSGIWYLKWNTYS